MLTSSEFNTLLESIVAAVLLVKIKHSNLALIFSCSNGIYAF